MDRLFLDANILFSAAYRAKSGLRRFWELSDVVLLSSAYAVGEAHRNLRTSEQLDRLEALVDAVEVVVEPDHLSLPVELSAKDRPILRAAIHAEATHLITGDFRHFGHLYDQTVTGARVMPPAAYLSCR